MANQSGERRKRAEHVADDGEEIAAEDREDSEDDDAMDVRARKSPNWVNRQRTLVFCSRGISYRARHLMSDVRPPPFPEFPAQT